MQNPKINTKEQQRRRMAVDYAKASVMLEGGTFAKEDMDEIEQYVRGEISLEQIVSNLEKSVEAIANE